MVSENYAGTVWEEHESLAAGAQMYEHLSTALSPKEVVQSSPFTEWLLASIVLPSLCLVSQRLVLASNPWCLRTSAVQIDTSCFHYFIDRRRATVLPSGVFVWLTNSAGETRSFPSFISVAFRA